MKPLRVCLLTTFFPPHSFGGDAVLVSRLAASLARDGHEVHVVHSVDAWALGATGPPGPEGPPAGVIVHRLERGGLPGRLSLLISHQLGRPVFDRRALRSILASVPFDVTHFHNVSLLGGPAVLGLGRGVTLCTLHDYWTVCSMHVLWRNGEEACRKRSCLSCTLRGRRPPQLWRATGALRRAARHVDAFLTGSETSRRLHEANGFPAPIRVLPPFVPDAGPEMEPRVALEPRARRPFFLFAGRLERLKGVEALLEVFRRYDRADLVMAGDGTLAVDLRRAAADLPHVSFTGALGAAALRELYRQAIAVVVPSLCYETFGLVPLEGFQVGTPALVRSGGALEELVTETSGGMVWTTEEQLLSAMEILRADPERRRELGEHGRTAFCERFTEERHMSAWYELVETIRARKGLS